MPRHQLPGGRQRGGQDQCHRRGLLPLDVQVVADDDRRAERPPRRGFLPRRRTVPHRCGQDGERRVLVLAQGRQGAQTQRKGVRTAVGSRGADSSRDRVAGRQCAHQRRRGRTPPLPQRLHLAARPHLPGRRNALQRRAGRTQPPAQEHARRNDAPHLRPATSRNGCNPSSRTITAPSRATASRSNCTTSRS